MPKPDQKVSISAALQRPQRQKALPKPLPKDVTKDLAENAENIETVLQPVQVTELEAPVELSELPSKLHEVDVIESKLESESSENITRSDSQSGIQSKPLIKIQNKVKIEAKANNDLSLAQSSKLEPSKSEITDKSKPILKPKLKPQADIQPSDPQQTSVTAIEEPNINHDLQQDASLTPLETNNNTIIESSVPIDFDPPTLEAVESIVASTAELSNDEVSSQEHDLDQSSDQELEQERSLQTQPIFWCQAVGLVAGKYVPSPEAFNKGELLKDDLTYKAFVLSKAVKSLEKKTDLSVPHQFIVYPKTSKLHGVRFEILATDIASKIEEFEDGQFNIRGLVTKQLDNSVLIEIQRRPEYLHPAQYDRFSLEVRGTLPIELIQQFVYVRCELVENYLNLVSYEHLACPYSPNLPVDSPSNIKITKTEKPILKPKVQKIDPEAESTSPDASED